MRFPRSSGVLLHPSSLPGPHGSGDLGAEAHRFIDWLHQAGQSLWQVLPLGGLGPGHSPYMSSSAFAGNVLLVDLHELHDRGWLDADDLRPEAGLDGAAVDFPAMTAFRMERLKRAAARFAAQRAAEPGSEAETEYETFCAAQADWLEDYALFMALAEAHPEGDWSHWPQPLARRQVTALKKARIDHAERIAFWKFGQWAFFRQWARLKAYANQRGVRIVGDAPIFIAHHSAEVWARPKLFELDADGRPTAVAGVPPDLFSATGQRWGNPLYRWRNHARDGYAWWIERIRRSFELVDLLRIDHFRGFVGYWEIPADQPTAEIGRWLPGPGAKLFDAIAAALGPLPLIAEDLGVITPEVDALRTRFDFPGMRILQFAWGETEGAESRFLPHRHTPDSVVYTGTHDNDTTLGWWLAAPEVAHHHLREYLASDGMDIAWVMIRTAWASVADLAIAPLQDVLSLDGSHRMNLPGRAEGNWGWRFGWAQIHEHHTQRLHRMTEMYGRLPAAQPAS